MDPFDLVSVAILALLVVLLVRQARRPIAPFRWARGSLVRAEDPLWSGWTYCRVWSAARPCRVTVSRDAISVRLPLSWRELRSGEAAVLWAATDEIREVRYVGRARQLHLGWPGCDVIGLDGRTSRVSLAFSSNGQLRGALLDAGVAVT